MTRSPLDDYLRELERALQMRGHVSEREAVERFGAPDLIARLAVPERK